MPSKDSAVIPPSSPIPFNLRAGWAHTLSRIPFATDHTMTAAQRDLFSAAADAKGDLSFPATRYPTSTPNPNGINRGDAFPGIFLRAVPSQTTQAETIPSALAVLHRGSERDACGHIYRVSMLQCSLSWVQCAPSHLLRTCRLDPVNLHHLPQTGSMLSFTRTDRWSI